MKLSRLTKILLFLIAGMPVSGTPPARGADRVAADSVVTFRFLPGNDMFFLRGNEAELRRLLSLVDEYRAQIADGSMPLAVDRYCACLPSERENLDMARVRANRVKSELITRRGLKEENFITTNRAVARDGNRDAVIMTLRVPAKAAPLPVAEKPKEEAPPAAAEKKTTEKKTVTVEETITENAPAKAVAPAPPAEPESPARLYRFAIRTNLLHDALLLPALGAEWRVNRHVGIRLDGSLARWNGDRGKVQKVWLLNPEARWYLLDGKRFYAGVSGSYGEYNIYKYPIGSFLSKDTGYQGTTWSAGVTTGYQLYLSRCFSIDFNLGLGYTRFDHDTFDAVEGTRRYKERGKTKNFWGPTQAGISLVWTTGRNK